MKSNKTLILFALAALLLVGLAPSRAMAITLDPASYVCTGAIGGAVVHGAADSIVTGIGKSTKSACVYGQGQLTLDVGGAQVTVQVTSVTDQGSNPPKAGVAGSGGCPDVSSELVKYPNYTAGSNSISQAGEGEYTYSGGSLGGCSQLVQFNAYNNTTEFDYVTISPLIGNCTAKTTGSGVLHCVGFGQ